MSNRFLKQLIYGSFFIIIFFAFGYGFFLFISPTSSCFDGKKNGLEENVDCGGSCQSCEIKALSKLEVIKAMLIPAKEGSSVLVFQIKNPNPFYGASSFFYKVYNETGEFSFLLSSGESFIYSGETKYVIEPLLSLNAESVKNIVVSLDNISWSRRDAFNSPDLNIRETSTKLENDLHFIAMKVLTPGQRRNKYILILRNTLRQSEHDRIKTPAFDNFFNPYFIGLVR